jgi:V8-like Glu-specific endopeptidase
MQSKKLWVVAVALTSLAGLCKAEDIQVKPRIIDGTNVPASQFPTVGIISDAADTFICTGTLIAPHFVLTAAHCAVSETTGQLSLGQTSGRFSLGGVTYNTVHIYANPSYHGDQSQETEGAIDLCIFELSQDVPNVTPSPLYRQVPTVGTVLTLVGYGEEGTGAQGTDGTLPRDGTVNFGHTPIDIVTSTFIKWNFDSTPAPNKESNTAPGDSGGPQFITVGGVLQLASVTSGGRKSNAGFGDLSYNTRVDIATSWIDSITGGVLGNPGNHAPTINSFTAPSGSIVAGQSVTFTAAVSDADNDPLTLHWIFGDGSEDPAGTTSESHTFTTDGTYLVQLIVTDGNGGSAQNQVSVQVGKSNAIVVVPAVVIKRKFNLNFKFSNRSTLDFTLLNTDFQFFDRNNYLNSFDGVDVNVYVGSTKVDSMTLYGTKGIGTGTLTFNYRAGTVRYQVRNTQILVTILGTFGAVNDNVYTVLSVPVSIEFKGVDRYGENAMFFYTGKRDRNGIGK